MLYVRFMMLWKKAASSVGPAFKMSLFLINFPYMYLRYMCSQGETMWRSTDQRFESVTSYLVFEFNSLICLLIRVEAI